MRNIKATVFSPQKVTVAEAYQAFLSILDDQRAHRGPARALLQDRRLAGRQDGRPGLRRRPGRPAGGSLHHPPPPPAQRQRRGGGERPQPLQVQGRRHHRLRAGQPAHHHRHRDQHPAHDAHPRGHRRRRRGRADLDRAHSLRQASDIAARLDEVFDIKGAAGAAGASRASQGRGDRRWAATSTSQDRRRRPRATRSSSSPPSARTCACSSSSSASTSRQLGRAARSTWSCSSTRTRWSSARRSTTSSRAPRQAAGGAAPAAGGKGATGNAPLEIFESRVKVSLGQGHQLHRRHLEPARLRQPAHRHRQLDQPRRQVFIEAVIMDLTIDRENQLGMAFHGGAAPSTTIGSTPDRRCSTEVSTRSGRSSFRAPPTPPSTPSRSACAARALPGNENLLGTGFSIPAFGVLINALAQHDDTDILSTPHILATDNIPAEINVGQNIPLQTNVRRVRRAPRPGRRGRRAPARWAALGAPRRRRRHRPAPGHRHQDRRSCRTSTTRTRFASRCPRRSATSPAAAAGLARRRPLHQAHRHDAARRQGSADRRHRRPDAQPRGPHRHQDPGPRRHPGARRALPLRSSSLQKSNLLLVLTPYIIREQADLRTVFERKMQERQEFLDHYFVFAEQNEYEAPKDYSRMNGLLEDIRQSLHGRRRAATPGGAAAPARDQDARAGAAARAARSHQRGRRGDGARRAARGGSGARTHPAEHAAAGRSRASAPASSTSRLRRAASRRRSS